MVGRNCEKPDTDVQEVVSGVYTDWSSEAKNGIESNMESDVNASLEKYKEMLVKMIHAIV